MAWPFRSWMSLARRENLWFRIGFDAWSLGWEASSVIALRSLELATGGATDAETRRMVVEKIDAALALQAKAMTGALGFDPASIAARSLTHYRRRVRANRRRLSKPAK